MRVRPTLHLVQLNRKLVQRTNMQGGSFLGVSRGGPKVSELVNKLEVSYFVCPVLTSKFRAHVLHYLHVDNFNMLWVGVECEHAFCYWGKWFTCWGVCYLQGSKCSTLYSTKIWRGLHVKQVLQRHLRETSVLM